MNKKNILMYCHNGSGNHGCEAIVRSTVDILSNQDSYNYYLISRNGAEDNKYGLGNLVNILPEFSTIHFFDKGFIKAYIKQKIFKNYDLMNDIAIKKSYSIPSENTVSLSIGGDNYCYNGYKTYIKYHNFSKKEGHKTVLWGCSVEPEFLEKKDIIDDLKTFDKIIVRESLSYSAMRNKGLTNIFLYPDPAFTLKKDYKNKIIIKNNSIGINISPMILDYGKKDNKIIENYLFLIRYILNNTDMHIVLLPHVVWNYNNDIDLMNMISEKFKNEERITTISDCNCMELKSIISQLRFLIAARTHASIAAYSMLIPTLVVGYSIKSRGIAHDIFGTDKNYVVSVKDMNSETELTKSFKWICVHEKYIVKHLKSFMPNYIKKAYNAGKEIITLFDQ